MPEFVILVAPLSPTDGEPLGLSVAGRASSDAEAVKMAGRFRFNDRAARVISAGELAAIISEDQTEPSLDAAGVSAGVFEQNAPILVAM